MTRSDDWDTHEIVVVKHAETARAIKVSEDDDEETAVWLPKSQIEIDRTMDDGSLVISVPVWLAREKDLL